MNYVVDSSTILLGSKHENYEREYFLKYWENFGDVKNPTDKLFFQLFIQM
ncbi:MAG: hypothetical protein LBT10_04785 [Methanobrevibacter sp.]|jgi:hypothetical protein|nr:hypothetical protein [Methanobrevibacter sp.]